MLKLIEMSTVWTTNAGSKVDISPLRPITRSFWPAAVCARARRGRTPRPVAPSAPRRRRPRRVNELEDGGAQRDRTMVPPSERQKLVGSYPNSSPLGERRVSMTRLTTGLDRSPRGGLCTWPERRGQAVGQIGPGWYSTQQARAGGGNG